MKKTLVLADGIVAKIFIQKIVTQYFSNNSYIIVCKDSAMLPAQIPSSIETFVLDYTSAFRLSNIFEGTLQDVFIIIENPKERFVLYDLVREFNPKIKIVLFNNHEFTTHTAQGTDNAAVTLREDLQKKGEVDTNLVVIDSENLVANRLTQRLPNVPLIPRGFGLEQGELMEIAVPPGSIFAYRHIGSIQQKKWRIVGIYRRAELILASHSLVILPNDVLLTAGDSVVLSDVYRRARSDIGQFPSPFGKDIFLYIDIGLSDEFSLLGALEDALFLHKHLKNNQLIIQVLNPANMELLEKIREIITKSDAPKVQLNFSYRISDFPTLLESDTKKRPGLIIINQDIFFSRKNRSALYKSGAPVLKVGNERIESVKRSFLIVDSNLQKAENIASVMFDISKQLQLGTRFYDFDPDSNHQHTLLNNIENLAKIFSQQPEITLSNSFNPILFLQQNAETFLQFIPFDSSITRTKLLAFVSVDSHKLSFLIEKNPQIFIPYL
ncbi:potassium transporter TrkA [Helicobacter sp. MIT 00-7814]|uniref:COG3400 family protein n=1 Tax=unclassified Helicobacter TaxID=2593540 RepID=UPI000E1E59AD|nr:MULTISPECIES: TrkA C-terminal domain-containing protein [unclassified Helicobacter]RDU52973.1 potassium transporter TrkA [Helicobacter sp. MIT 00-7814]RDU53867.1 potassium transporter TrkA [Helicobacter sp. MIT 99-10781]